MTTIQPTLFTVPSTKPVPVELVIDALPGRTARDAWAIQMIAEHRALTAAQLTALGFHHDVAGTERRLRILVRRGWLDCFRAGPTAAGAIATVWCLGPLGAAITAPPTAGRFPRPTQVYRDQIRLRDDPHLIDLLATNQFFVDLAAHARTQPATDLRTWWSPRTCAGVIAPALHRAWYGEYIHYGRRVGFWLEPDFGDTSVATLANRIQRYRPLAERTGLTTVLVTVGIANREADLHGQLARLNLTGLTVATTSTRLGSPAEAVWLPVDVGERIALRCLPETPPLRHPNDDAFVLDAQDLAPHPIHDPNRPGDEAIADGDYSYTPHH